MEKNKYIGVVILNYNSYNLTIKLVNKLSLMSYVDYICVVDNNSNDNFDNLFESKKIHYIKNNRNLGYAAGNNIGLRFLIEEKGCDVVFISNPDVIFEEETVIEITRILRNSSDIVLASAKRYGPSSEIIHQYHIFPSLKESIINNFYLARKFFLKKKDYNKQYKEVEEADTYLYVDAVPGAFLGIRSSFLVEISYMYEGTFLYCEEIILGRQAKELGYKAAIINTCSYIHNHKMSHFSNRKMFWQDRQSLLIYYKKFHLLNNIETFMLKVSILLGTIEYNVAYFILKKVMHLK